MSINCRHKTTEIIDQRKVLCRQIISKFDCVRKCSVDRNILITSWNDRKIIHSIRIATGTPTRIKKWNQLSHFRRTYLEVTSIEKTQPDYTAAMS